MNMNPTGEGQESARREDYSSGGTPTAPVGSYPSGFTPSETVPHTAQDYAPPSLPTIPPQSYQQPIVNALPDRMQHRGAPIVGPVILIGAGVVFLLNNLEVLPWGVWNQLWRLWPLILIAVGLDILVGKRNALISLVIVLALVGSGVAFLAIGGGLTVSGELETANVSIPVGGARSVDVTVSLGTGNLTLDARANPESLVSGTLEYYTNRGEPEHEVTMSGDQAVLNLRQHDGNGFNLDFLGSGRTPDWTVHLNPALPMNFKADLGNGNSTIDLSRSKAATVDVDSGAGNSTIVFPAGAGAVTGKIDGGVGNLTIKIPDGLEARIDIDTGIGNITVDNRFAREGESVYLTKGYSKATNKLDLKLDVGLGNVEISR